MPATFGRSFGSPSRSCRRSDAVICGPTATDWLHRRHASHPPPVRQSRIMTDSVVAFLVNRMSLFHFSLPPQHCSTAANKAFACRLESLYLINLSLAHRGPSVSPQSGESTP